MGLVVLRRVFCWALLATLALGFVATASPATADEPISHEGTDYLGTCLRGADETETAADILLLLDNSGSLKDPRYCEGKGCDPNDVRLTAAREFLEALANKSYEVSIAIATFGEDFKMTADFANLGSNLGAFKTYLDAMRRSTYDSTFYENYTDYYKALRGAGEALDRQRQISGSPCRAIVWFSDGDLDVDTRQYSNEYARNEICKANGIAYFRTRISDVVLIGLGLGPIGEDFSLMESISTGKNFQVGRGTVIPCGPPVDDATPGDFYHVTSVWELIAKLMAVGNAGDPTLPLPPNPVCDSKNGVNQECRFEFVIDDSIQSISLLAWVGTDAAPDAAFLVDPGGNRIELKKSGGSSFPGSANALEWSWPGDPMVSATLSGAGDDWRGAWYFWFEGRPGMANAQLTITSGLRPHCSRVSERIGSGDPGAKTTVTLRRANESIDAATLAGTVSLNIDLKTPDGRVINLRDNLTKAQIGQSLELDDFDIDLSGIPPGKASIDLTLDITTAPWHGIAGSPLAQQKGSCSLTISSSSGLDLQGPINFGYLQPGATHAEAQLKITGAGDVWLDSPNTVAGVRPTDMSVRIGSSAGDVDHRVSVKEGEEAHLNLSFDTDLPTEETLSVTGRIAFRLAPPNRIEEAETQWIDFQATLQPLPDKQLTVQVIILSILLGLAPVPVSYLIRKWSARIPPPGLEVIAVPVTIDGSSIRRNGQSFELSLRDWESVPYENYLPGRRGLRLAGGPVLKVHVPWSPYRRPTVRVVAPGLVGVSMASDQPHGRSHQAELPLLVHNTWFLTVDPADRPDRAMAYFLAATDADRDPLKEHFKNRAATAFEHARSLADTSRPAPTPDPDTEPEFATRRQPGDDFDPFA